MSEPAPPGLANDAPVGPAPALTPEAIRAILADFEAWLTATAQTGSVATSFPPDDEPIDLHTLLGQFVALRHEVNLQTRATRAQQEQNAETLRQLTDALESLETRDNATPAADGEPEEESRPLLKTLVELHDALTVGGRETVRAQETVSPLLHQIAELTAPGPPDEASVQPPAAPLSGWRRFFGGAATSSPDATTAKFTEALAAMHAQEMSRSRQVQERLDRLRQMVASLVTGYTMSLQRVERALQKHGLEPMAVVGAPFDPERMEVLDLVYNSGRPSGEVVEEVRRGYLLDGRVFRHAQVRVAKA